MEISEGIRLARWFSENAAAIRSKYANLVSVLSNNSQQQNQMPVTEPLNDLSDSLSEMPTQELSTLQMRVLERLGVAELIGSSGKQWINSTIRISGFDPATTFQNVHRAQQRLSEAQAKLEAFASASIDLGFTEDVDQSYATPYMINIIFQSDASIENVRDWKSAASDWEFIMSAVAGVAHERPEDVKVASASTGSIVFTLSASAVVTKIMAIISKHIASIANDYLDFQIKKDQLEKSRMMTEVIRQDLTRQESERKGEGKSALIDEIRRHVPNATAEEIAKLETAIDRHIAFSERGGEVDFVAPPSAIDADDGEESILADTMASLRDVIGEFHKQRDNIRLITMRDESAGSN